MKAVVAAFNQEKAVVGAFSVITNLRMELFEALASMQHGTTSLSVVRCETQAGHCDVSPVSGAGGECH